MKRSQQKFLAGAIAGLTAIALVVLPALSASAAIGLRGSTNAGPSQTTSLTIPKPGGLAAGDFMIVMLTVQDGTGAAIAPPTGTGTWTLINRHDRTTELGMATYWKFATAADVSGGDPAFGISPNQRASGGMIAYTGVDTTTPIDDSNANGAATGTMVANEVTTTTTNTRLIAFFGSESNGAHTLPTGMTNRIDAEGSGANANESNAWDEVHAATGLTGNRTSGDSGSNDWIAQLIAIREFVDVTGPVVTIDHPADSSIHNVASYEAGCSTVGGDICGTATDATGVASIEMSIQQGSGNYWSGTAFDSGTELFHMATGTTSWSLAFPGSNFPADGEYTVRAKGTDTAAPANTSTPVDSTFTLDDTQPDVTIEQASGQDDPTNASPVEFEVEFTEDVSDFDENDVDTSASTATVGTPSVTPVDGDSYTVSVPVTDDGDVVATIAAGGASDAAGNTNNASTSTDNTVTYDDTEPTSAITFPADDGSYNEDAWNAGCSTASTGDFSGPPTAPARASTT